MWLDHPAPAPSPAAEPSSPLSPPSRIQVSKGQCLQPMVNRPLSTRCCRNLSHTWLTAAPCTTNTRHQHIHNSLGHRVMLAGKGAAAEHEHSLKREGRAAHLMLVLAGEGATCAEGWQGPHLEDARPLSLLIGARHRPWWRVGCQLRCHKRTKLPHYGLRKLASGHLVCSYQERLTAAGAAAAVNQVLNQCIQRIQTQQNRPFACSTELLVVSGLGLNPTPANMTTAGCGSGQVPSELVEGVIVGCV